LRLEYYQMVDRVERIDRARREIACRCLVPETSPIFEGHFPKYPLLPGTLMIETIAQTAGYLLLDMLGYNRMPVLIRVDKAKIRDMVPPGSTLLAEGRIVHEGSGFAVAEGRIVRDGRAVAEAEIRYRTMPFPNAPLRDEFIGQARAVGLGPS
jgi:3-hydroxyacyl-[acyl-carrier-protein] dehydratase